MCHFNKRTYISESHEYSQSGESSMYMKEDSIDLSRLFTNSIHKTSFFISSLWEHCIDIVVLYRPIEETRESFIQQAILCDTETLNYTLWYNYSAGPFNSPFLFLYSAAIIIHPSSCFIPALLCLSLSLLWKLFE